MATPLDPSNALEAQLITNRAVKVDRTNAALTISSNAGADFTASSDPVLRFAYKKKSTTDATTFTVGFRTAGDTNWLPGVAVEISRDGTAVSDAIDTWGGVVDFCDSAEYVFVAVRPTDLESLGAVAVEVAVDLESGEGIVLYDVRLDIAADA
jgi:hypothetical protein